MSTSVVNVDPESHLVKVADDEYKCNGWHREDHCEDPYCKKVIGRRVAEALCEYQRLQVVQGAA